MLLHSPIKDTPISELGVCLDNAPRNLPEYAERRANVAIFLTLFFSLAFGRRDLLPFAWAWARASAEQFLENWTPDEQEQPPSIDSAVEFCRRVENLVIDYKLPTIVPLERDGDNGANVAHAVSQMASRGLTFKSGFQGGDPIAYLAKRLKISDDALTIMAFTSMRVGASTMTAMLSQESADEPTKAKPDMSKAQNMIEVASQRIAMMLGAEFMHYPELVVKVFERLSERDADNMETVWEECVEALFRKNSSDIREATDIEDAKQLRDYRWRNGSIDQALANKRDECAEMTTNQAIREAIKKLPPMFAADFVQTIFQYGEGVAEKRLSTGQYEVVSFLSDDEFERLQKVGHTETPWELAQHGIELRASRFSDDPLHVQTVNERRLWGEKAIPITMAALVKKDDEEHRATLRQVYGENEVTWPFDVLNVSTLTINDCSSSPFAVPATPQNRIKALIPLCVAQAGQKDKTLDPKSPGVVPLFSGVMFGVPQWTNFVQVQIHQRLNLSDALEVRARE